ncbi:MAG: hypothetical protein AAFN70_08650 [Planctomycetota bacterium]
MLAAQGVNPPEHDSAERDTVERGPATPQSDVRIDRSQGIPQHHVAAADTAVPAEAAGPPKTLEHPPANTPTTKTDELTLATPSPDTTRCHRWESADAYSEVGGTTVRNSDGESSEDAFALPETTIAGTISGQPSQPR